MRKRFIRLSITMAAVLLSGAVAQATTIIIDNVDAGYSETGSGWATWGIDPNIYGADFSYKTGSTTNDTASWAFTGLSNDNYKVYVSWPPNFAASPSAPYSGTDGFSTNTVNQTNAPVADLVLGGVDFQELGIVDIADGTFTATVTGGAGQLRADAVALVQIVDPLVIDNVDAGYSDTGWLTYNLGPNIYGDDFAYETGSTTNDTAAWTFTGLSSGNYKVYASWPPDANASPSAPYSGTDDFNPNTVNQTNAPAADLVVDGVDFQELGIVAVDDGDFTCTVTGGAGQLRADAVALLPTDEPAPPFAMVVGIVDGGFSQTGFTSGGTMYYANDGGASASASWAFTGVPDGTYDVAASWVADFNRSTEAPYSFSQGLAPVTGNQFVAPDGYEIGGTDYEWLGTLSITGGVFTVTLTDDASLDAGTFVIAQSVALVSAGESVVVDNVDAGYSETGSGWAAWGGGANIYGADFRFKSGSISNDTASWAFSGLGGGVYDVYVSWPPDPSASPAASYSGTDGLATTVFSQLADPVGKKIHGTVFQKLGTVTISDGDFTGTVSTGGGQLRADSMALVLKEGLPHPPIALQIASDGSTLDFEWNSQTGTLYDLLSSDSLTTPSWSGYGGYTGIAASGTGTNTLAGVATDGAVRFFRVIGN